MGPSPVLADVIRGILVTSIVTSSFLYSRQRRSAASRHTIRVIVNCSSRRGSSQPFEGSSSASRCLRGQPLEFGGRSAASEKPLRGWPPAGCGRWSLGWSGQTTTDRRILPSSWFVDSLASLTTGKGAFNKRPSHSLIVLIKIQDSHAYQWHTPGSRQTVTMRR